MLVVNINHFKLNYSTHIISTIKFETMNTKTSEKKYKLNIKFELNLI